MIETELWLDSGMNEIGGEENWKVLNSRDFSCLAMRKNKSHKTGHYTSLVRENYFPSQEKSFF